MDTDQNPPSLEQRIADYVPAPPPPEPEQPVAEAHGSPDEPPIPHPVLPATPAFPAVPDPPVQMTPLNSLRAELQPIMRDLVVDRAYLEQIKRSSPRMFLDYLRMAFATELEGKGSGGNAQVIIQAPFPRGPLDVLPPHLRVE